MPRNRDPLYEAIMTLNLKALQQLLNEGTNLNQSQDVERRYTIMPKINKSSGEYQPKHQERDRITIQKETPLQAACLQAIEMETTYIDKAKKIIELLLQNGAEPHNHFIDNFERYDHIKKEEFKRTKTELKQRMHEYKKLQEVFKTQHLLENNYENILGLAMGLTQKADNITGIELEFTGFKKDHRAHLSTNGFLEYYKSNKALFKATEGRIFRSQEAGTTVSSLAEQLKIQQAERIAQKERAAAIDLSRERDKTTESIDPTINPLASQIIAGPQSKVHSTWAEQLSQQSTSRSR